MRRPLLIALAIGSTLVLAMGIVTAVIGIGGLLSNWKSPHGAGNFFVGVVLTYAGIKGIRFCRSSTSATREKIN